MNQQKCLSTWCQQLGRVYKEKIQATRIVDGIDDLKMTHKNVILEAGNSQTWISLSLSFLFAFKNLFLNMKDSFFSKKEAGYIWSTNMNVH